MEGRDHPPPPLEATKASRGPARAAASSSQRRWSRRPFAAGWGQEEGYSWTWSDQRNNAGVPTETHPAFPTTGSSGKRALASGRRSSEFSQVSRLARTFSPTKTIAEGSTAERRECWLGACRREFKWPSTGRENQRRSVEEIRLRIILRENSTAFRMQKDPFS